MYDGDAGETTEGNGERAGVEDQVTCRKERGRGGGRGGE